MCDGKQGRHGKNKHTNIKRMTTDYAYGSKHKQQRDQPCINVCSAHDLRSVWECQHTNGDYNDNDVGLDQGGTRDYDNL